MFVLEALVLTFMTTPLVTWLYPAQFRRRVAASGANFRNVADDEAVAPGHRVANSGSDENLKTRFTVVLDKLEHLPGMMVLTQLIQPSLPELGPVSMQKDVLPRSITTQALRLIELSDRVSAVMKSSISDTLILTDPMLSIFRMFGHLNGIKVSPALSIVKFDDLAYSVAEHAKNHDSDMILMPWLPPVHALDGGNSTTPLDPHQPLLPPPITPNPTTASGFKSHFTHNPFDLLFKSSEGGGMPGSGGNDISDSVSLIYSQFVRGVFSQSTTDVALFVDQNTLDTTSIVGNSGVGVLHQHIFLPFFGGPDDRLALDFVVQICANPRVRGTVVRMTKSDEVAAGIGEAQARALTSEKAGEELDPKILEELNRLTVGSVNLLYSFNCEIIINTWLYQRNAGFPDTVYGQQNTEIRMQSDTADNVAWAQYVPASASDTNPALSSNPHVEFKYLVTPIPLHAAIQEATAAALSSSGSKLVVVTGRSRRLAVENHGAELQTLMDEHSHVGAEVRKTIGDVATAFVVAGVGSGVVVVQSAAAL